MSSTDALRKEYTVLWKTGLCKDGEEIPETAAVCSLGLDSGETTLIRTFYKDENDDTRAEDHLLEWLQDLSLLQEADDIHIKIFLNYSPQGATSEGLVNFIHDMEGQEKSVSMTVRFVRLYKVHDEDEAQENKDGLRLLKRSKVTVDVVRECDWLFLMNVLINRATKRIQGRAADTVKTELEKVFQDPKDADTNTEKTESVDADANTEKLETVDVETMTDEIETVDEKSEDSSSDDED